MDYLQQLQSRVGGGLSSARDALLGLINGGGAQPAIDPSKDPNSMQLTVKGAIGGIPTAQAAEPASTAMPMVSPDQPGVDAALAEKIRAGYRKYGKGKELPMEKHIPAMVAAAQKYPVFQKNPMLIPATSIVETSAGSNTQWQYLNNPLSWGARLQKQGLYNPQSEEEAINDMITAVGGDPDRGKGYDPEIAKNRMRTAGYYDKFRQSNNLQDFVDSYDGGNEKYLPALLDALKYFE